MDFFRNKTSSAFTIVEMIVVITVIAILASVVVVSYGTWERTTSINKVKSDLVNAAAKMQSERTFANRFLVGVPATFETSDDVLITGGGSLDGTYYCLDGTLVSDPSIQFYVYSRTVNDGAIAGDCLSRPSLDPPIAPLGVVVTNILVDSANISWTNVLDGDSYMVQCATDAGFISGVIMDETDSTPSTLTELSLETTYFCHVRAVNSSGVGAWSTTVTFNT